MSKDPWYLVTLSFEWRIRRRMKNEWNHTQILRGSFSAVWIATIASKVTFYSIFQALQDKQTFAPLTFQNFQIFAHFRDFCRCFQNFAENSLKSQIFRWIFHGCFSEYRDWEGRFFGEIFMDFFRNFGKLQTIAGSHYLLHKFLEIREKMVLRLWSFTPLGFFKFTLHDARDIFG